MNQIIDTPWYSFSFDSEQKSFAELKALKTTQNLTIHNAFNVNEDKECEKWKNCVKKYFRLDQAIKVVGGSEIAVKIMLVLSSCSF